MTDLEKLTTLLDEWGVPYVTETGDMVTYGGERMPGESVTVGGVDPGEPPKVAGYMGFYTLFVFDQAGAFVLMGAWE